MAISLLGDVWGGGEGLSVTSHSTLNTVYPGITLQCHVIHRKWQAEDLKGYLVFYVICTGLVN